VDRARSVRSRAFDAVTRTVVEMLVPSKKKKKNRTLSAQEISGWVSKKGGAGLYQKRWLRLRGNVLSWSLKETSQNTKGAIMVRNSQVVPSKDGKTFSIVPSDRSEKTYTFQVSEKKDMVMWVSVLQMASLVGTQKAITIEEKRKSTGGGVKSKVDMSLEARLTRYYKKYNPDQLEKIPYLAKKYKGTFLLFRFYMSVFIIIIIVTQQATRKCCSKHSERSTVQNPVSRRSRDDMKCYIRLMLTLHEDF